MPSPTLEARGNSIRMKRLFLVLAFLITACAAPIITPSPSVGGPRASIATTIAIDCGPFSGDIPNCLAIVEAAARVVEPAPVAGSRAEVSNSVALADCPNPGDCPELAAAVSVAQVRLTSPSGDQVTVDVMAGGPPPGGYFGLIRGPLRSP
jgi:hypothetical protein